MSSIGPSTPTRSPASRGSGRGMPASTSSASAHSSIVRAIGPTWSKQGASGKQPSIGTSPWLGLKPAVPQAYDGMRIEPPVSVPMLIAASPAASAAALPPEEPPATWPAAGVADGSVERILARHAPSELVQVRLPDDHRAGVDHALHGARSTDRKCSRNIPEPYVVRRPAVSKDPWVRRDAGQGAHPALARERAGVGQRALAVGRDERVELAPRLAPVEVVRDDSPADTSPARTRCAIS